MATTKTKYIGFRTPPEVYEKLAKIAEAEERSISYIVNRIIREALEKK